MRPAAILSVSILCIFSLHGCGAGPKSYDPTNEGITWVYQSRAGESTKEVIVTNLAPINVNRTKVIPRRQDEDGRSSLSFLSENDNGLWLMAVQGPAMPRPVALQRPHPLLKYPLRVGTFWVVSAYTNLLKEAVPIELKYEIDSVDEVVTVPAGTYRKCLRIRALGHARKTSAALGTANVKKEYRAWMAPGVGMVKAINSEEADNPEFGSGTRVSELKVFRK